jgi:hypothetical protein
MTTVPELIAERQKTIAESWQSFLKYPLPIAIAEVVKRKKAKLPPDYLPWAPAVVIASDYLLRTAGHTSTSGRPTGWRLQRSSGDYKKGWRSFVRKRGQYWMVEDDGLYKCVLAFSFGSMPVCTRTPEAVMRLAEYFGDDSRTLRHGLRWLGPTPDGILDC